MFGIDFYVSAYLAHEDILKIVKHTAGFISAAGGTINYLPAVYDLNEVFSESYLIQYLISSRPIFTYPGSTKMMLYYDKLS